MTAFEWFRTFIAAGETQEDIFVYIHKSLVLISAFYAFFLAERLFKLAVERRKQNERKTDQQVSKGTCDWID